MKRELSIIQSIDKLLLALFAGIVFCGLVCVYSATYTYEMEEMPFFLSRFWKQVFWVGLSVFVGVICLNIHSYFYDYMAYFLYAFIIILLLLTPLFAHNIKGSLSWISLGPISFQPAELAKCITALAVASYLGKFTNESGRMKKFLIPLIFITLPMFILVFLQKETGSALVFTSFVFVFFRCGLSPYFLIVGFLFVLCFVMSVAYSSIIACIILTAIFVIWYLIKRKRHSSVKIVRVIIIYILLLFFSNLSNFAFYNMLGIHQQKRIEVILGMRADEHGVGYNANQSKIAIGSGGFLGKGFLQGTQNKLNYLPEHETDFIFCTVGEEWGFIGANIVLLLYFSLLLYLIRIAERQKNMFNLVFIYSFTFMFLFHVAVNIGMVLDILPIIGIPLPFFSYGGSSFLCFSLMLFITLRLDIEQKYKL